MTPFLQYGPYIAIDFETSSWTGACACAVGMIRLENLEIVDRYYTLIRPASKRIRYTDVHGLTWDQLKKARSFREVWPDMLAFLKGAKYLVAHNASFDRRVLQSCCEACNLEVPKLSFLCTLVGTRKALRLKSYSLGAICEYFGIELNHHHAGSDAAACGLIQSRLLKMGMKEKDLLPPPKKPEN